MLFRSIEISEVMDMKGKRGVPLAVGYCVTIAALLCAIMGGSRAVTVISENLPIENRRCIVIDPGHGGEDGGAVSCTGIPESRFNLDIALRLNDLLHLLGHQTKMIRSTDTSVYTAGDTIAARKMSDLKERVRIVSETENALLVSIHQNTFPDGRYSGAQVFYCAAPGSEDLAKQLQTAFVATVNPGSNRKCKKSDGVYLMEHIHCTGVLVECGFLSNPSEEGKLQTDTYQKQICCVIAASVSNWLGG